MSAETDYWQEAVACALDEVGVSLTKENLEKVARSMETSHENYGQAFYSPPASERIADIERGWKAKVEAVEAAAERYRRDFVKNICTRHNVEPSQVTLEGNGEATICK